MTTPTLLHTEIGRVEATATDGEHIHVGSRALNVDPLRINGVEYYLSAHLYKDGEVFTTRSHTDLYMSRSGLKDVSPAARKKAERVVTDAVNAWIIKYPTVLIEAQAQHLAEQIRSRNEKIADLRAQIATLEEEITGLSDENYRSMMSSQKQEA